MHKRDGESESESDSDSESESDSGWYFLLRGHLRLEVRMWSVAPHLQGWTRGIIVSGMCRCVPKAWT